MPTYVVRWSQAKTPYEKVDSYEFDEFFVERDPDPFGEWVVWYRHHYMGGKIDYWTKTPPQTRRSAVLNRSTECVAGSVERLYFYDKGEPRIAQLSRLAMQIERGRACLFNRPVRRFEGLSQKM